MQYTFDNDLWGAVCDLRHLGVTFRTGEIAAELRLLPQYQRYSLRTMEQRVAATLNAMDAEPAAGADTRWIEHPTPRTWRLVHKPLTPMG